MRRASSASGSLAPAYSPDRDGAVTRGYALPGRGDRNLLSSAIIFVVPGAGVALNRFYNGSVDRGASALRHRVSSTHLLRRLDAEQSEPGGENRDNALHQRKARQGHMWIILDNEA